VKVFLDFGETKTMKRRYSTGTSTMKRECPSTRRLYDTLLDALLRHGLNARWVHRQSPVFWEDGAGRFNTGTITLYEIEPFLVRLYCNFYPAWVRYLDRYRFPEAPTSELTFLPSEFPALAEKIAQCMARGERINPYAWTQAAWEINPHKGPDDDGSPPSNCLKIGEGLSLQARLQPTAV
jgi:hypothetical protein